MEDADVIDNFCNSRKLGDIIKLAEDEDLPVVTALDVTEIEATPAIQQTYLLQPV